jgi:hypothetical protein
LPHTLAPQPDDIAKPTLDSIRQPSVTKYPKVHQLVLTAAYAPYLCWLWATGGLVVGGQAVSELGAGALKDPAGAITTLLLIARGVNVALHLGLVALVYAAARRLARADGPALAVAALFGLSPVLGLFARGTWVDVPMLFWTTAALLAWLAALEQPTRRRLLAYFVLAVLAVCCKDQAAFALIPVSLCLVVDVLRRGGAADRRPLADLAVAAGAGLLLFALLNDLFWAPHLFVERLQWWSADMAAYRRIMGGAAPVATLAHDVFYGVVCGQSRARGADPRDDRACSCVLSAGWRLLLPMLVYGRTRGRSAS